MLAFSALDKALDTEISMPLGPFVPLNWIHVCTPAAQPVPFLLQLSDTDRLGLP